jgi:hypothetical protein
MSTLKRFLPICTLLACVMSPAVALAADATPGNADKASSPNEKGLEEWLNFLDLGAPKPTYRTSCTATTGCLTLGGVPQTCTGHSNCMAYGTHVNCDDASGNLHTTWCTCNPGGISNCNYPADFCDCWNASHNYRHCWLTNCV